MMIRFTTLLLLGSAAAMAQSAAPWTWNSRLPSDRPITPEERWKIYLHNNFGTVGAAMRVLGPTLGAQLSDRPKEWDKDGAGFGRRLGVNFAMFTTRDTVHALSSAAYGHDPRYQRCDCQGFARRLGHAISGTWLSADADGVRRFDTSNFTSAYAAGFVGASLYPSNYQLRVKGLQLGHQQLGQIALRNVGVEFGPDIRKFLKAKILRR